MAPTNGAESNQTLAQTIVEYPHILRLLGGTSSVEHVVSIVSVLETDTLATIEVAIKIMILGIPLTENICTC